LKILVRLRGLFSNKSNEKASNSEELKRISIIWESELKDISDNDINRAISECSSKFSWAPNIAEFKNLCLSYKPSSFIPWVPTENKKKNSYESINRIINEGAIVCKKLKEIYPDLSWMKIGSIFTKVKNSTKKFHPNCSNLEFLIELSKYNKQDLIDSLNIEVV